MKRLHFRYEMQLQFDREVTAHHFVVRCIPCTDEVQRRGLVSYQIRPADALNQVTDGFGNVGLSGSALAPHAEFSVLSEGEIEVGAAGGPDVPVGCAAYSRREELHPMYRFYSNYTQPDEALLRFIKKCGGSGQGANAAWKLDMAQHLMHELYQRFRYVPGVTNTSTTAAEAFAGGEGVCQDYAHILISMCRGSGIPARYVAGMMVGEGATHAWAEVYADGAWIGLDPTHDRMVDADYIKLTHGRDFADAAVDKGCFFGAAAQLQQVHVLVEERSAAKER